jgi:hypothetical protein
MLLHGIGLIIGTLFAQTLNSDLPDNVIQFMRGATFTGILLVLLLAALLWVFSGIKEKVDIKLLLIVATGIFFLGIIEIIFFFPYAISIISAILVFIALFKLKKVSEK